MERKACAGGVGQCQAKPRPTSIRMSRDGRGEPCTPSIRACPTRPRPVGWITFDRFRCNSYGYIHLKRATIRLVSLITTLRIGPIELHLVEGHNGPA